MTLAPPAAPDLFRIDSGDAVATALHDLPAGTVTSFGGTPATLRSDVPFGHKVALAAIAPGEPVLKFGFPIGVATAPIDTIRGVALGTPTAAERNDEREIAIWKRGVTL